VNWAGSKPQLATTEKLVRWAWRATAKSSPIPNHLLFLFCLRVARAYNSRATMEELVQSASAPGAGTLQKFGRELLQTVLLVGILFFGVRTVMQNFRVEGPSMQPTLTSGEFLWVNKAAYFEW